MQSLLFKPLYKLAWSQQDLFILPNPSLCQWHSLTVLLFQGATLSFRVSLSLHSCFIASRATLSAQLQSERDPTRAPSTAQRQGATSSRDSSKRQIVKSSTINLMTRIEDLQPSISSFARQPVANEQGEKVPKSKPGLTVFRALRWQTNKQTCTKLTKLPLDVRCIQRKVTEKRKIDTPNQIKAFYLSPLQVPLTGGNINLHRLNWINQLKLSSTLWRKR